MKISHPCPEVLAIVLFIVVHRGSPARQQEQPINHCLEIERGISNTNCIFNPLRTKCLLAPVSAGLPDWPPQSHRAGIIFGFNSGVVATRCYLHHCMNHELAVVLSPALCDTPWPVRPQSLRGRTQADLTAALTSCSPQSAPGRATGLTTRVDARVFFLDSTKS